MKLKKRQKKNQGNSFIVVVATLSFLAVLTAALLVAVALCYRLKAYDINAKDNFYYLEQAMDEIYAGVGGDTMTLLNQAYDDTIEVMVYYDMASKSYVTMDNDKANDIMMSTFMKLVQNDSRYSTKANTEARLRQFLSRPYTSSDTEGVQLSIKEIKKTNDDMTIASLVLKREAIYSTVNTNKTNIAAGDTFVQSITTDIVIAKPTFNVNFNTISSELSELYAFAMISDMGVEVVGPKNTSAMGDTVTITGNVYAAADFYNKGYNENPGVVKTAPSGSVSVTADDVQRVSYYKTGDSVLKNYNGEYTKSMYSGIYVDGADLVFASEKIIVPGTIAAMNTADITINNISSVASELTEVWADSIVLDGFSVKANATGTELKGSSITMKAEAYISDDLEVNANSAEVKMNGKYYGYNYASVDNRTYTTESIRNGTRSFTTDTAAGIKDGSGIEGQAHYNSSAIILNGENTTLDFSLVDALYVAGQSYIEVSKKTTKSETGEVLSYDLKNEDGTVSLMEDTIYRETDSFLVEDEDGDGVADNYTVDDKGNQTVVQDYRTGEAISVKSNQLAYIPTWAVNDNADGLYLSLPARLKNLDLYKNVWTDLDKIPVVKTVISGKKYYFFDFSQAPETASMNQFIEDYAKLFDPTTAETNDQGMTTGESYGLINITDYEYFQVKMLSVGDETDTSLYDKIYTNSAITTRTDTTFTIKARSDSIEPLLVAATSINSAAVLGTGQSSVSISGDSKVMAANVTTGLQKQYREMKYLLSRTCTDATHVTNAHNLDESLLTPINHFFDFSQITADSSRSKYCALNCGYGVWYADGDVEIGADSYTINGITRTYRTTFKNGKVQGLVITNGNVYFKDDVKEFEGLIVSGGKIIVDNFAGTKTTMDFIANEEIIKTILRECDSSRGQGKTKNFGYVCDTFKLFVSQYKDPALSTDTPTESMKELSAIQYEDILSFQNWKKNVD